MVLLTTAALLMSSAVVASTASADTVRKGAVFNNPVGSKAAKWRIVAQVEKAIANTCRGGCLVPGSQTILISTYLMDRRETTDKLIAAHHRGANVQVVMDSTITSGASNRLVRVLGPADKNGDRRVNALDIDPDTPLQRSFAIKCENSCRGGWGNNHDKFYAFTQSGDTSNVVMVSSANLNKGGALNGWNDMYTMTGRQDVYDLYSRVHGEMAEDDPPDLDGRPIERYYVHETTGSFTHRFFPRKDAGRDDDPSYQQLEKIRCNGATGGAGRNGRTVVKIAMFWWSGDRGMYLADKVIDLDKAGCDVQVIYGAPSHQVSRKLRASAHRGGIKLWDSRQRRVDDKPTLRVHSKYMLVSGSYAGTTADWRVMTGTQNWIGGALTGSDENTLEIDSRPAYSNYSANFDWLKTHSRRVGR